MKRLLLALFLASQLAYAAGSQVTASGGSPIPTAFSVSDTQSQVRLCSGNVVEILNQTASVLAIGFGTSTSVPGTDFTFIPPGPAAGHTIKPKGGISGNYVYIRSAGSSTTSGSVQVSCYFED